MLRGLGIVLYPYSMPVSSPKANTRIISSVLLVIRLECVTVAVKGVVLRVVRCQLLLLRGCPIVPHDLFVIVLVILVVQILRDCRDYLSGLI